MSFGKPFLILFFFFFFCPAAHHRERELLLFPTSLWRVNQAWPPKSLPAHHRPCSLTSSRPLLWPRSLIYRKEEFCSLGLFHNAVVVFRAEAGISKGACNLLCNLLILQGSKPDLTHVSLPGEILTPKRWTAPSWHMAQWAMETVTYVGTMFFPHFMKLKM